MADPTTYLHDRIETPVGRLVVVSDGEGRLRMVWFDDRGRGDWRASLFARYPEAKLIKEDDPHGFSSALNAYFSGEVSVLDGLRVAFQGTPFQMKVWKALRSIPCGATQSYGALARRIQEPSAVRAVGLANGANPIAIVVPCHRVIGSDGSLTGYGGGLPRKKWLLAHEARYTASNFRLESSA